MPPPPQAGAFPIGFGYDPRAPMEQRSIVSSKEGWSEFVLDDGVTIRIKGALVDVKRVTNQYTPDGNPLYIIQFAVINNVIAPDKMKQP
jgi:hypothetical protein